MGTNTIVGQDGGKLRSEFRKIAEGKIKKGQIPPLWDGKAGERITRILLDLHRENRN